MLVDTFSNRLKKALEINNMKQSDLVYKSKLDKSLISNYLSGKYKAKQDKLSILANILHVSETWLMGYNVPISNVSYENITNNDERGVKVPVLGRIPAGIPIEAIETVLDYEEIPQSWLKGNKQYFALKIQGDSMEPQYQTRRYCYI